MNRKLKTGLVALFLLASITAAASKPKIYLKSGTLSPEKSVGSGSSIADIKQKTQYKVLQFREPTTEAYRNRLADKGLTFHAYIPENAWIVDLNGANRGKIVRKEKVWFIGPYKTSYKIDASLKKFSKPGKRLNISVEAFRPVADDFKVKLEKYGEVVNKISESNWEISTVPENISRIAGLSSVKMVSPGIGRPTTMNAVSRKSIDVERLHSSPFNLQGEGFTAAVWDAGWAGLHEDLNYTGKRVIGDKGCGEAYCTVGDHPTHVSGTLLGGGKKKYKYRGMAPKARLATYEWPTSGSSELYSETNESINKYNSVLSQNSWGYKPKDCDSASSVYGNYPSWSRYYDKILGGKSSEVEGTLSVVFSAGNAQGNCGLTYNTTTYPSTAKNVITVGAVDDNVTDQGSDITSFSSLGPTDDGRIKPDVVANGLGVNSAIPDKFIDQYSYDCDGSGDDFCYPYDVMSGTSMAAPAVSGAVVLVNQKYNRTFGDKPAPATVKGLLVHNAEDINRTGPDYVTGWGLVNATETINYIGEAYEEKLIKRGTVDQGGNTSYTVNMSTGSSANFTLVWSDYPASAGASKTLVNDLDLVIRNSTGHRYYPWTLNWSIRKQKAVRTKEDHRNNVVQIHIPKVTSEKLHISVNGTTVPKGPQSYSLLMSEKVQLVPELKIKSPLNKSYGYTPDFNLSSSSPLESAKFSVDGGANFSMANKSEELFYNTTTQLQEGEHKVTFYAEYEEGKWTSASQKFKIDRTRPQLEVKKPAEGENLSNSVKVNATWSDLLSGINVSEAYISNKSGMVLKEELNFTFNSEKLEDGKYNITYNVTDKAGNYKTSTISVTIDNTPPEISYYSPKEEALSENFTINASYKDATTAVKSAEYLLANSTGLQRSGTLNATLNSSKLEEGDYTLSYRVKDYAGNLREKNVTVTVDNSKPTLSVVAPENGSFAPRNFWINATWNGTYSAAVEANFTVYNDTYSQSGKLNTTVSTE
ncbi:MAG: S8 family serine peptidase, partial [Candidatus Nanohalobium sp.]